ncbi:MAG: DUF6785 family protein [Capsulimonadales bacterium]|nr:DUF6785 family protein [Capsulimonadales bacterium]
MQNAMAEDRRLRWFPVSLLAFLLIVLNEGWITNSEMRTGVTEVTISTLFSGVVFILFFVTLLNLLVRRLAGPKVAFNQPELMALYTMLSLSSVVGGVGHMGFFLTFLANPFHEATEGNDWKSFWNLLPPYLGPQDPSIVKGFYEGNANAFEPRILQAWAFPLIVWSVFFIVLLWTTLCLSLLLRRRWAAEERLPFPVIAVPLEMTREGTPLFRNYLLWLGFAFPFFLHSLNSLQYLYPSLPVFHINSVKDLIWDASLQFPLTGAGSILYQMHPAGVGFGFLVSTDVSFSLWFFYLLKKAVLIGCTAVGWRDAALGWGVESNDQPPYIGYQSWGAWLALGGMALWSSRAAIRGFIDRTFEGDPHGIDRDEPMSARAVVLGFTFGFLALCAFAWSWGGSWWLPILFLSVYLLFMIAITRLRAEMPVLSTELGWVNPQTMLPTVFGTTNLSRLDLAHMATLSWFNLDYRAVGMPHEMEGMVGMENARGRLRTLLWLMAFAVVVALVAAILWDLNLYYTYGAKTGNVNGWRHWKGSEAWSNLGNWLHNPKPPNVPALLAMIFGAGFTVSLAALRTRFFDLPFHPAAYALNASFANDFFWGDMFIAWTAKSLILRYGGIKMFRTALPFFLGLILGDFVTGAAWSLFGSLTGLEMFRTFAT